jgi:hypothetical protein
MAWYDDCGQSGSYCDFLYEGRLARISILGETADDSVQVMDIIGRREVGHVAEKIAKPVP